MIKATIDLDQPCKVYSVQWHKKGFFKGKKLLKSSGLSITESLTKLWIGKLTKARDEFELDGRVCYIGKSSQFPKT